MTVTSALSTALRVPTPADAVLLAGWRDEVTSPFEDFGGDPPPGTAAKPVSPPAGFGQLAVVDGGQALIGDVTWLSVLHGPNPGSRALNIGIGLRPDARGQGHGSRAQRMLAAYLFRAFAVNRVEASTDVLNVAERRALERAGFSFEGVLRGAQWRGGQWHHLALYARLRSDAWVDQGREQAPGDGPAEQ